MSNVYTKLLETLENDPEWFNKCHVNEGTAILCICPKCKLILKQLLNSNIEDDSDE